MRLRLETRTSGRHAAYCGFVAASAVFGISFYLVLNAIVSPGVDFSKNWVVLATVLVVLGLQGAGVVGLYYYSRIAAVGSFAIFLALALTVYFLVGLQPPKATIIEIILALAFIQGIRGTFAFHRRPKERRYMIPR